MNITVKENKSQDFDLVLQNDSQNTFHLDKFFKICKLADNIRIVLQEEIDLKLEISPGTVIEIKMHVQFPNLGAYLLPLVFKIRSETGKDLYVLKEVIFRAQTELMDMLAPLSPYKPILPNITKELEEPVIPYKRSIRKKGSGLVVNKYNIPDNLNYIMQKVKTKEKDMPANQLEEWKKLLVDLKKPLTMENYIKHFQLLLHLEELQMKYEMLKYGQNGRTLEITKDKLYELEVPGLAEKRPSILKGDTVHVRIQQHHEYRYEGYVTKVLESSVILDFHDKFKKIYRENMLVDVRFSYNRLPLQFAHRAVELMGNSGAASILFPSDDTTYPTLSRPLKAWRFPGMVTNMEQQQAVRQIVNRAAMPAPYLIFGPPGTGKTVTLVEAISQVWLINESKPEKQLVCAPTNSTADLLTVKLLKAIPKAKIVRIYAVSVDNSQIHQDILSKNCWIMCGNPDDKQKYDIIITTIVTAGRLINMGLKREHFSYVYVDECGQAMEPEALIPVAGILVDKTVKGRVSGQLVLAGDPKQLGPVLQSLAKKHGLELSFLERLMETNSLYQKDKTTSSYNSKYITKLIQNFRSHKHILKVPNDLFYDNDLQVKGDEKDISRFIGWNELPNPDFPIIFHGIEGIDERECSSPSYFNRQEIDVVIQYMRQLFSNKLKGAKVMKDDIGIITPYSKQVQKFRRAFNKVGWNDVKVGTVEQFQGDEKLVIIVSTVRSSQELLDHDYKYKLGFLSNPKRFNVAVTRPKGLLILVGNPKILCRDNNWLTFMNFVHNNRGTRGVSWNVPEE